jgi:hypothetical protein
LRVAQTSLIFFQCLAKRGNMCSQDRIPDCVIWPDASVRLTLVDNFSEPAKATSISRPRPASRSGVLPRNTIRCKGGSR